MYNKYIFPYYRNDKGANIPMTWDRARDLFLLKGNFTNPALITVIQNFYADLNSGGYYDKLEYLYFCFSDKVGGTNAERLDQNAYNLINPNNFKLTYYNNPIVDSIGIQWSIPNKAYASTNFIPKFHKRLMTNTQACAGIYQTTNAGGSCDFGSNNSTGTDVSFAMNSNLGGDLYDAINCPIQFNTNPVSTIGMNTMIRDGEFDTIRCRHNGAQTNLFFPFATSYDFCDLPLLIGALGPISNNGYSNNKFNHHFVGTFTAAELASYETLVNTYQANIETALGLTAGDRKKY